MLNKTLYIGISLTLVLACSKSNELDSDDVIIEEEFEQLYSCVSYSDVLDPKTTNQDDSRDHFIQAHMEGPKGKEIHEGSTGDHPRGAR